MRWVGLSSKRRIGNENQKINLLIRIDMLPFIHSKLKQFLNKNFCLKLDFRRTYDDYLLINYYPFGPEFHKGNESNNVMENTKNQPYNFANEPYEEH